MEALAQFLPLLLIAAVFYLLLIRPQQNRQRQHRALMEATAAGDRVVTIGGLHGTVESVDGDTIRLELAPGTVITVAKAAVARRLIDAATGVDE
jgi:preprotein translocase subunit YajC